MATPNRTPAARRPRRVVPLVDIEKQFLTFATAWRTTAQVKKSLEKSRDIIKEWFDKGGDGNHEVTVNDQGSLSVEFDEPVMLDGVTVTGLTNVRRESTELDLDRVDQWLDSQPEDRREELSKRLYKRVTDYVFQEDALYALQQEGVVSEAVLESFQETRVVWALTVDKA